MRLKELVYAFSVEYIRSSYYKKVLRSFLLCSCAVALLFCGVLLFASNRDYGSELASTQEQVLEQAVNINATRCRQSSTAVS